jgi:ribonuclease VapC
MGWYLMFLDASAIIAILTGEDDAGYLVAKIETARKELYYSPISAYEAVIGLARKKSVAVNGEHVSTPPALIDEVEAVVFAFLADIKAVEMAIEPGVGRAAIKAARQFGRATEHPAQLSFGDCFAYACARAHRLPLLFKGDDFSQTDIETA